MNAHEERETRIVSRWFTKDFIALAVQVGVVIWWAAKIDARVKDLVATQEVTMRKVDDATNKLSDLKYSIKRIDDLEVRIGRAETRMGKLEGRRQLKGNYLE